MDEKPEAKASLHRVVVSCRRKCPGENPLINVLLKVEQPGGTAPVDKMLILNVLRLFELISRLQEIWGKRKGNNWTSLEGGHSIGQLTMFLKPTAKEERRWF